MIEINLLPEERKKKKSRFQGINPRGIDLRNIPARGIIYVVLAALVFLQVLLFSAGIYCRANYNALGSQYKNISPEKTEADRLNFQSGEIKKKVAAIDELMVNRFRWAKKLNDLSDSMTASAWLTELSYEEKVLERLQTRAEAALKDKEARAIPPRPVTERVLTRYMVISGYVLNSSGEGTAVIGKFIKNLKDNKDFYSDFNDIQLDSIKREKVDDQEAMRFKIACLFKESAGK